MTSCGGSSYVCSMSVYFYIFYGIVVNIIVLTSFPFFVGYTVGSAWVPIWPLVVG
jgi:hypothetical protein